MSKNVEIGDLVTHKRRNDELFIVTGYTYRITRWARRKLMRVYSSKTGEQEFILEEQLVIINPVNSEKSA